MERQAHLGAKGTILGLRLLSRGTSWTRASCIAWSDFSAEIMDQCPSSAKRAHHGRVGKENFGGGGGGGGDGDPQRYSRLTQKAQATRPGADGPLTVYEFPDALDG